MATGENRIKEIESSFTDKEKKQFKALAEPLGGPEYSDEDRAKHFLQAIRNLPEEFRQKVWNVIIVTQGEDAIELGIDTSDEKFMVRAMADYMPEYIIDTYKDYQQSVADNEVEPEFKKYLPLVSEDTFNMAVRKAPFYHENNYAADEPGHKAFDWSSLSDAELAQAASNTDGFDVIINHSLIAGRANFKDIVLDAAKNAPTSAAHLISKDKSYPYAEDMMRVAATEDKSVIIKNYNDIASFPLLKQSVLTSENIREAAIKNPWAFFENYDSIKDHSNMGLALSEMATQHSDVFLSGWFTERFHPPAQHVEQAASINPMSAYVLSSDANTNASQAQKDKLIHIAKTSMQNYLDHNSGQGDNAEIDIATALNDRHEMPNTQRFDPVSQLNASGYYQILTQGRAEAYTSTYNYLYDSFMQKLDTEKKTFAEFLHEKPERLADMPSFIEGMSTFNKFGNFLGKIGPDQKEMLSEAIMNGMKENPLNVVAAADYIKALKPGDSSLAFIESRIVEGFATSQGKERDAFGTLGRWYAEKSGHTPLADNMQAFDNLEKNDRYKMPDFEKVESSKLFDAGKRHFQMHIFYNDEDGHTNYDFYKGNMKRDGWSLKEDQKTGIAHFEKSANGRQAHIYATIPQDEKKVPNNDAAVKAIQDEVARQNGKITLVAHRGHSYFVAETIPHLNADAEIVFLGACGGNVYIQETLDKSPNADIIATSGIGTRFVNEPLLAAINDRILSGKDISWIELEKTRDGIGDERKAEYKMPSENLAAMFISKLNRLEKDDLTVSQNNNPANQNSGLSMRSSFQPAASGLTPEELTAIPGTSGPVISSINGPAAAPVG